MLQLESIFAGYETIRVLHGVSVELRPGTLTAIVGPNGGGKSTLLRVAAGLLQPESGRITLVGSSIDAVSPKVRATKLAFIPQRPSAAPDFSVREVIRLGRFASGRSVRDRFIDEAIAVMNLEAFANRPLGALSVGQQQRVAVARALAQLGLPDGTQAQPRTLLADEPVAAMDPAQSLATMGVLRSIAKQGHAVGMVLHDLSLAARFADRVVVLTDGRVQAAGAAGEVLGGEELERAFGTTFKRIHEGNRIVGVVASGPATLPA